MNPAPKFTATARREAAATCEAGPSEEACSRRRLVGTLLPVPAWACLAGLGRAVADMCSNQAIAGLANPSAPAAGASAHVALAGEAGGSCALQGGAGAKGAEGAKLVLEHRKLSALLSCHVNSLLSFCHQGGAVATGGAAGEAVCRVHPLQVQMGCATGRVGTR